MVNQTLAAVAIELQPLIEVLLLEHDAIVDAGDVAGGFAFTSADSIVIRLFAAGERREQIVADGPHVEFVEVTTVRRRNKRNQPIAGQPNLGARVEVVILGRKFHPRPIILTKTAAGGGIEQIVGGQVLVNGVSKMW
jgi:hypothetical protein